MSKEELLLAVKEYTARGFVVHPLSRSDSKTPPNIEIYITGMDNIWLVCGKSSRVTVIDIDHELVLNELSSDPFGACISCTFALWCTRPSIGDD